MAYEIVYDQIDRRVRAVDGPYWFFGCRAATVDEVWIYREQEQEVGRREVHDPFRGPAS